MSVLKLMDAVRISDGRVVVLKRLERASSVDEVEITRHLSQEDFINDTRNHCVPALDVLDPEDGRDVFLVIPLLRRIQLPPMESVDDVVNFVEQTLEVRDISSKPMNILLILTSCKGDHLHT